MGEAAPERPLWFVSDVHLTPARPERTQRFLAFLDTRVRPAGADLIVAGDLFDWWFASHPPPPDVREVIDALESLPGAVAWLEGNHDVFVGRGLDASSPIGVSDRPITVSRAGLSVHVAHGDLVDPSEVGYRAFRALLRGLPGRLGARLVGPRITRAVGAGAASGSRTAQGGTDGYDGASERWLDAAKAYASAQAEPLTVLGHGHWFGWWPGLVCLGDWLRWSSYARLDAEGLSLWRYARTGDSRVLGAAEGAVPFS
jgi:UDP-2,3-diacylglucosamine hydrolase